MTQELSPDEKATVARFEIHDEPPRVKVWCVNWSFPDAPHAALHIENHGELDRGAYFDTWEQAMARADVLAQLLRKAAVHA